MELCSYWLSMFANGPAIKGGCVPPAGGWRAFCRHGTGFIAYWRDRGTKLISGRVFIPVDKAGKWHWRSIAVQFISEQEICQGAGFILRAVERIRVQG